MPFACPSVVHRVSDSPTMVGLVGQGQVLHQFFPHSTPGEWHSRSTATHRQSQRVSDAQHGTSPMKLKKKHTLFSLVLLAPRSRFAGNTPPASGACCAKLTENSYGKVKFGSEQFSRSCELTEQKTNFEFPKIRIL